MANTRDNGGGLSLSTLIIASLSSLAAALVVHKFWQGGAILGAAVTPVIVALVSEALRKPVDAVKSRTTTVNPPPLSVPPPRTVYGSRRRLHVGLAVTTGIVAFAIAAFFLTGAELVLGGASDSDRLRVVPGKQKKDRDERERDREQQPATTQEQDEARPAPEEEQEQQPTVTVTAPPPEETTPDEAPPETAPEPGATTPVEP